MQIRINPAEERMSDGSLFDDHLEFYEKPWRTLLIRRATRGERARFGAHKGKKLLLRRRYSLCACVQKPLRGPLMYTFLVAPNAIAVSKIAEDNIRDFAREYSLQDGAPILGGRR